MTNEKTRVEDSLIIMGFKGSVLADMKAVVRSDGDLEELEVFILNNEDRHRTLLSISKGYRKMKQEQGILSKRDFVNLYDNSQTILDKQSLLSELLLLHVDVRWVEDLDKKLHNEETTVADFYEAFLRNKNLPIRRLILESTIEASGLGLEL